MYIRRLAFAALIACSTAASAIAQASNTTEPSSIPPFGPKELLISIQSAMAKGELLHDAFYSRGSLQRFLGTGYRLTEGRSKSGQTTMYFDDRGNTYLDDQGNPTPLGRHRPCLVSGTAAFETQTANGKPRGGIAMLTAGSAESTCIIHAEMVREVFGAPGAVREGFHSTPPLHGLPYVPTPRTNEFGNLWLDYQAELDGQVQRIQFRTLGDGSVVEIRLSEEQRSL